MHGGQLSCTIDCKHDKKKMHFNRWEEKAAIDLQFICHFSIIQKTLTYQSSWAEKSKILMPTELFAEITQVQHTLQGIEAMLFKVCKICISKTKFPLWSWLWTYARSSFCLSCASDVKKKKY